MVVIIGLYWRLCLLFRIVLEVMFVIQDYIGGYNCYSGLYWRLCLLFRIVLEVIFVIQDCTGGCVCY